MVVILISADEGVFGRYIHTGCLFLAFLNSVCCYFPFWFRVASLYGDIRELVVVVIRIFILLFWLPGYFSSSTVLAAYFCCLLQLCRKSTKSRTSKTSGEKYYVVCEHPVESDGSSGSSKTTVNEPISQADPSVAFATGRREGRTAHVKSIFMYVGRAGGTC